MIGAAPQELRETLRHAALTVAGTTDGVDGLGITLLANSTLVFAGCNAFTDAVDQLQYGLMEGPCLTAQHEGRVVRCGQVEGDDRRWPAFSARAATVGLRHVASAPLLDVERVVGSVNLYGKHDSPLPTWTDHAVRATADTVSVELARDALLLAARENARWFERAARARARHDLAVGVLMDRFSLSPGEAQVLIQQIANEDGVSVPEVIDTVLAQDG